MSVAKRVLIAIPITYFNERPTKYGFCRKHEAMAEAFSDKSWGCHYEAVVEISEHSQDDYDQHFDPCRANYRHIVEWMRQSGVTKIDRTEEVLSSWPEVEEAL